MTELEDEEADLADTSDEDRWTVMRAAAVLLQKMAFCVGESIWAPTVEFVSARMANDTNWKQMFVGLTALGAVISAPRYEQICDYFSNVFPAVIDYA